MFSVLYGTADHELILKQVADNHSYQANALN